MNAITTSQPPSVRLGLFAMAALLLVSLTTGCGGGDPRAAALEERIRWSVNLRGWTEAADSGQITLDLQVSGPPTGKLEQLTFRMQVLGGADEVLHEEWKTLDLSTFSRGAPKDVAVRLPAVPGASGVVVSIVANPTDEEAVHIPELAGL